MAGARFVCHAMEERSTRPEKGLNFLQLLGVLFIAAIGGAYGMEGCVKSGGGLWTIIGVLALPWVWGLPTAMVVAELATSMPANSGPDAWISCAFPTWFTVMSIIWTFMINRVDNSLYPNLFISYLLQYASVSKTWQVIIMAIFVSSAAILNMLGVDVVGKASVAIMVLTLAPFFLMFAVEFMWNSGEAMTEDLFSTPAGGTDWTLFIPLIVWNISGFDSAGHVVEEVQASGATLIKALVALLLVTQVVYLMPVAAGISAQSRYFASNNGSIYDDSGSNEETIEINSATNYSQWSDGYFVGLSREVANGDDYLPLMMTLGGMISSFGFMTSMLCTTSRALQGHALLGLFPEPANRFLRRMHPRYKTPCNAIALNAVCCFALAVVSTFETLVSIDVIIYSFRLTAIFAACVIVRFRHPTLPRPFAIPLGRRGLFALVCLPVVMCLITAGFSAAQDMSIFGWSLGIVALSLIVSIPLAKHRFPEGLDARIEYPGVPGSSETASRGDDTGFPAKETLAINPVGPAPGVSLSVTASAENVSLISRRDDRSSSEHAPESLA